jgi:ubiquinone/menaquinone biosynthesis C-methylase UbiE
MTLRKWKEIWRRFAGRGIYPHELAPFLLFPLRSFVLSPRQLVRHLHLARADRVLELGPGPGFFSIAVARAIPEGRLALVDIQLEMLQKAQQRLRRAGIQNAGYTQASGSQLPFQSAVFDVAFLVAMLGEVSDPKACLAAVAGALRPGGWLSIAELPGDPDALTASELQTLAQGAGLEFVESLRVSRSLLVSFRRQPEIGPPTAGART